MASFSFNNLSQVNPLDSAALRPATTSEPQYGGNTRVITAAQQLLDELLNLRC